VLISLCLAIESIGEYTTESVTHGQCDARPTVLITFPANGQYQFILLGEQRNIVCEQLAQSRYVKWIGRDSNLRPLGCKSDALTTTPPCHNKSSPISVIFYIKDNHLICT